MSAVFGFTTRFWNVHLKYGHNLLSHPNLLPGGVRGPISAIFGFSSYFYHAMLRRKSSQVRAQSAPSPFLRERVGVRVAAPCAFPLLERITLRHKVDFSAILSIIVDSHLPASEELSYYSYVFGF